MIKLLPVEDLCKSAILYNIRVINVLTEGFDHEKYAHILATIDVFQNKLRAIESALQLADIFQAELSVMHIVTHRLYNSYGFLGEIDVEETITQQAREKMQALCAQRNIPEKNQIIRIGHPKIRYFGFGT